MVVSVGAPGMERRIVNVADGIAPTDAVNVRQLRTVEERLDKRIDDVRDDMEQLKSHAFGGIASVAAMSAAPVPEGATLGVGVGFATYGGHSAGGISATWRPAPFMSVNTGVGVAGNNAPTLFRIGMSLAF
jgi:autotransporter adhesin